MRFSEKSVASAVFKTQRMALTTNTTFFAGESRELFTNKVDAIVYTDSVYPHTMKFPFTTVPLSY